MPNAGDFGFSISGQLPAGGTRGPVKIGRFQGYTISHDEDGFFWENGGYSDTLEEIQGEIRNWNGEDARANPRDEPVDQLDYPWNEPGAPFRGADY